MNKQQRTSQSALLLTHALLTINGIVDNHSFLQQKAPPAKQRDCRFAGGASI
jgi:hypothetical protein